MLYGLYNKEFLLQLVKNQMLWEEQILLVRIINYDSLYVSNLILQASHVVFNNISIKMKMRNQNINCPFTDLIFSQWLTRDLSQIWLYEQN